VIGQIRSRWNFVRILVRRDSAYSREEIMKWCESQVGVDYVLVEPELPVDENDAQYPAQGQSYFILAGYRWWDLLKTDVGQLR